MRVQSYSTSSKPRCPMCRVGVDRFEAVRTCPVCNAGLHAQCVRELGGCHPVEGFEPPAVPEQPTPPPAAHPMRRQRRRRSRRERRRQLARQRADDAEGSLLESSRTSGLGSSDLAESVEWTTLGMLGVPCLAGLASFVLAAYGHPAPLAPMTLLASLVFGGLACLPLRGLLKTGAVGVNTWGRWRELRFREDPLPFLVNLSGALGLFAISAVFAVASVIALVA